MKSGCTGLGNHMAVRVTCVGLHWWFDDGVGRQGHPFT